MSAPTPSKLDFQQVLQGAFDDSTGQLRTDAVLDASSATIDVIITDAADSVKIGDGSGHYVAVSSNALKVDGSAVTQPVSQGGLASINHVRNDYTGVNVTTSAYVQLLASTSGVVQQLYIFDSSGQTLVLATGGAGVETDQIYISPGGNGIVPLRIAASTRVSIKAVTATANTGEIHINFLG